MVLQGGSESSRLVHGGTPQGRCPFSPDYPARAGTRLSAAGRGPPVPRARARRKDLRGLPPRKSYRPVRRRGIPAVCLLALAHHELGRAYGLVHYLISPMIAAKTSRARS